MERHGGNVVAFAEAMRCGVDEVIDLSSNINFVRPKLDVDFNTLDVSAYPNYKKLSNSIAQRYAIEASNIELFNGATVGIHTLFRGLRELGLNHCSLYAPLYGEYASSAKTFGYEIELVNRFENIEDEVQENSLVIFVNPSTPDGAFYDIEALMQRWIAQGCTILIDESFLDFTPYHSAIAYIEHYDKLYLIPKCLGRGGVLSIERGIEGTMV